MHRRAKLKCQRSWLAVSKNSPVHWTGSSTKKLAKHATDVYHCWYHAAQSFCAGATRPLSDRGDFGGLAELRLFCTRVKRLSLQEHAQVSDLPREPLDLLGAVGQQDLLDIVQVLLSHRVVVFLLVREADRALEVPHLEKKGHSSRRPPMRPGRTPSSASRGLARTCPC